MVIKPIIAAVQNFYILTWDVGLSIFNLLTPNLKPGHVIPEGHPGAGGSWPEYIAPKEGDSRCSCPALDALANHGILPHDGKGIPLQELTRVVRATYNFSPSLCYFVPLFCARMLGKDYNKDVVDLSELDLHNGIEHDALLTRQDLYHEPNQATPHLPYIEELLASPSGKAVDGSLGAPSTSSTMLTIMGGRVKDLESFLVEERIPDGWEPKILSRNGLTILGFNRTAMKVGY
ncbi:Chloroperoxidase, partial [Desarmillaria tabescens]